MPSITLARTDVIIGVDTHKHRHVAVAVDGLGGRLDDLGVDVTTEGYEQLLAWAQTQGRIVTFGIEGTGSYGIGLTRFLRRHGHRVIEVARPDRAGRRLNGKDDTLDAEHAARAVLSGKVTVAPKGSDGDVESIRLIKVARDTAVKARSQAMITLKSVLVTATEQLRSQLEPLTDYRLVTACAQLAVGEVDTAEAACRHSLRALARRWLGLHEEIKAHAKLLETRTRAACPALVEAFGIGADTAADLLIAAGDDAGRIRSDAAYAKLCGVAPIPASSGNTTRHRLSRGGNRQANAALHRIVTVRMRWHEPTKAYVARRTAEGKTKREIMRCLKRYVAREVFRLITAPPSTTDPSSPQDRLDDL